MQTPVTDSIRPIPFPYQSRPDAFAKTRAKLHAEPFRRLVRVGEWTMSALALAELGAILVAFRWLADGRYFAALGCGLFAIVPSVIGIRVCDVAVGAFRQIARDIETSV